MMIDKVIKSPNFIKLYSPNYYILTNNIIDCNFREEDARHVLNVKYPRLGAQVDDKEWERLCLLYNLLYDLRSLNIKLRSKRLSTRARRASAVLRLMAKAKV